jgi:Tol biopolymer transport system component
MKTTKIIKSMFGAVLSLLVFASTNGALAQAARIAFTAPASVQTSVKPAKYSTYDQIFSMNPDGSGVVQLTSAAASSGGGRSGRWTSNTSPSFAPIISW